MTRLIEIVGWLLVAVAYLGGSWFLFSNTWVVMRFGWP